MIYGLTQEAAVSLLSIVNCRVSGYPQKENHLIFFIFFEPRESVPQAKWLTLEGGSQQLYNSP